MGFIRVQCPHCGSSNVELDDSREYGFCTFCGGKIVRDKIIVEHRGNVSISGIADTNSIMDRAKMFLEDGKFDDVYNYCERALDINPRNVEAYVMRLMAETKHCRREDLAQNIKPLEKYDSYRKAIRFASPELQEELSGYNERTKRNFKEESERRLAVLEEKESELQSMRNHLAELEDKADKNYIWIERHDLFKYCAIGLNVLLFFICPKSWGLFLTLLVECLLVLAGLWLMDNRATKYRSDSFNYREWVNKKEEEFEKNERRRNNEWLSEMQKDC